MTKPTVILLVLLLCLWASGSFAASTPVFCLGFPIQLSISSGTFIWIMIPTTPGTPGFAGVPVCATQSLEQSEQQEQEPEDPEYGPSPVRPDIEGELSGDNEEQEPPP